jgi:hypothetical protein
MLPHCGTFDAQGAALPKFPFSRPQGTDPPKEYVELRRKCPIAQVSTTQLWIEALLASCQALT